MPIIDMALYLKC